MKLLMENWRKYVHERIDSFPLPKNEPWDIGETFVPITKLDIIKNPSQNVHQKNTLLDFFVKLKDTQDENEVNNILKTMYSFSGNSDDFKYSSQKNAVEDYLTPHRYGGQSLKDYHEDIKKIVHDLTRHTKPAY